MLQCVVASALIAIVNLFELLSSEPKLFKVREGLGVVNISKYFFAKREFCSSTDERSSLNFSGLESGLELGKQSSNYSGSRLGLAKLGKYFFAYCELCALKRAQVKRESFVRHHFYYIE